MDWAASTKNKISLDRLLPIFLMSLTLPTKLSTWEIATIRVFGLMALRILSGRSSIGQSKISSSIPLSSKTWRGRRMELCSYTLVMTWSPAWRDPNIAIFKPSVQFFVKAIFFVDSAFIRSFIFSRTLKTSRADFIASW